MVNIKNRLQINGVFQFCLRPDSGKPLYKINLFIVYTAHYNVGVSDINS